MTTATDIRYQATVSSLRKTSPHYGDNNRMFATLDDARAYVDAYVERCKNSNDAYGYFCQIHSVDMLRQSQTPILLYTADESEEAQKC